MKFPKILLKFYYKNYLSPYLIYLKLTKKLSNFLVIESFSKNVYTLDVCRKNIERKSLFKLVWTLCQFSTTEAFDVFLIETCLNSSDLLLETSWLLRMIYVQQKLRVLQINDVVEMNFRDWIYFFPRNLFRDFRSHVDPSFCLSVLEESSWIISLEPLFSAGKKWQRRSELINLKKKSLEKHGRPREVSEP